MSGLWARVHYNCTDYQGVLRLCKGIVTTKSSGVTDISSRVFKDAFLVLVPQLVYMFNLLFDKGAFPDKWKEATLIPLYKGGSRNEVGNYRPVSLLPIPGKLLERVVHAKMSKFLERMEVITHKQGGFRKGFLTTSSVVDLTDKLFESINKGMTTLAVFVDLRKAFDTVDHNILQQKLECYGIRGSNLAWCGDYLRHRGQRTMANGTLSNRATVECGVPQGSVLGPLFFILYVNDMQHAVHGANIQLYADDTVIFVSDNDPETAARLLQPSLNKFALWCSSNKLSLNVKKTKLMTFGTRQRVKKAKEVKVSINAKPLQLVPTYKYLGIVLDSVLSYNYHVNSVIATILYIINLLSKIRLYLTDAVEVRIFKSMILPYFDYGDVIYSTAGQEMLDKLQRLQNRCLKMCLNVNNRSNTDALHTITNCPELAERRRAHVNNFMHGRLSREQLLDTRDIRTRVHDAPLFKIVVPKNETYKRSVEYAGSQQWNSLAADTRNIRDASAFKRFQKCELQRSLAHLNA